MAYADNIDKQRGIAREPIVAERIKSQLEARDLDIVMKKSSLLEDMRKKYDYSYKCAEGQSFANNGKVHEIKVDIKCGETLTIYDDLGRYTLEHSESTFIVSETYVDGPLIWINTGRLKDCLKLYPGDIKLSKYNNSKYIFIESYLNAHKNYLGKFVKYIK
jgi:hypothetical protein